MNDSFLVRMLNGMADLYKKFQPLMWGQLVLVTKLSNLHPLHQFHHKVRPAGARRARIQHLGDVRMIHERECLALGVEPGNHIPGVHPELDDLQCHQTLYRFLLGCQVHGPAAALPELLQQFIAAHVLTQLLTRR